MKNFYISINQKVNNHPLLKGFTIHSKILTIFVEGCYITEILHLIINSNKAIFLPFILKPLCTLLLMIIIRKFYDTPRPFEKYNFKPIVEHETGQSFPSKHSASAMIIALMFYNINIYAGLIMLMISLLIGISRILAGIHHIKDVIAGYILALIIFMI